jgi:hypothetical protein
LGAEVFEPRLEPRESLVEALGGELALLESLEVPLERLLGAGDLAPIEASRCSISGRVRSASCSASANASATRSPSR